MNERTFIDWMLSDASSRVSRQRVLGQHRHPIAHDAVTTVRLSVTCSWTPSRQRIAETRKPSGHDSSLTAGRPARSAAPRKSGRPGAPALRERRTDSSMRPTSAKIASTRSAVITSGPLRAAERSPTLRTIVGSAGRVSNCTRGSVCARIRPTSPRRTLSPATISVSAAIRPPPTNVPHRLPRSLTKQRTPSTRTVRASATRSAATGRFCADGDRPAMEMPVTRSCLKDLPRTVP